MRIRSSAASIAAFIVTAGLLAGCSTGAAPEPTEAPAASTPAPSPTATPAAAPDLAALCERLLPLETVQERFGEDSVLLTGRPSARADISGWASLLRGRIDCEWGSSIDRQLNRNVVVTLSRGDTDFFSTIYEQTAENIGDLARYDTFGSSLDACDAHFPSCQYSVLVGEHDWLELDLSADYGSTLLPVEQIRERWDPEIERMIDLSDEVLSSLPTADPQPIECASMLSVDEARQLTGADDVEAIDIAMFFHDMSLFGVGGPTLSDLDRCDWSDYNGGSSIAVLYTEDPRELRATAFTSVSTASDDRNDAVFGEEIEIPGADEAWRFCFAENPTPVGCGIDVRVRALWMQVRTESDDVLLPATERIIANLNAAGA